ncbi:MAG TPA: hypothetical protein VN903_34995 [Polyangia bacterium]|nr:hypothetical protein [Polyangia bacterium]
MTLRSAAILASVLVVATGAPALGAGGKRAGVPKFDGGQEVVVRKRVMQVLKAHGYELAKSREMDLGVANTGALLDADDGFAKVAKELALSVIVTGEVGKKRTKITVHDGRDGATLGQAAFPGANPRKMAAEVGRTFWSKLGGEIERGRAPAGAKKVQNVVEAPDDDESAPDVDDAGEAAEPKAKRAERAGASDAAGPPDGAGASPSRRADAADDNVLREEASAGAPPGAVPPTFDAFIAPTGTNRALVYHQDYSPAGMRPYTLPAAAAPTLRVVWYPISALSSGPMQHLGLEAAIEQAFGLRSAAGADGSALAGKTFGNAVHEYAGGLRYRIPFGAGHQVWISGTAGEHAFVFTSPGDCSGCRAMLHIPDTIYRYGRPGIGLRLELPGDLSFALGGGYRYIVNAGGADLDAYFPHRTVGGVDADLALGYRIGRSLEIRASGQLRRYFYDMHSKAGDAYLAGGAIDQYWTVGLGMAVLLGGGESLTQN